ncbi:MAG: radical SAM protein [Omnitrophica WOR_2 bacterium]
MATLVDLLDKMTVEGSLYESLPDNAVRCYACGHRCLIREGKRGICKVRFNKSGKLYVPWGYVGALQADPIEKKPFFHVLPGSDALTFGMLGCDFHCGYCFPGETIVISGNGPVSLQDAFVQSEHFERQVDAEIGYPIRMQAVTASGNLHPVRAIFKHPYRGELTVIKPYYLPSLKCTPDHRIYATEDIHKDPIPVQANQLTQKHYLAIPRNHPFYSTEAVNTAEQLYGKTITYRVRWDISESDREMIAFSTANGQTSRQIGLALGKDPSYIRHVRSKMARGIATSTRTSGPLVEEKYIRFPNEHHPGLPLTIPITEKLARLIGYYCAEGSIVQNKKRPNSYAINFSFALDEIDLAEEVRCLIQESFGFESRIVRRDTTLTVSLSKASAALFMQSIAGKGAMQKQIPFFIFKSPRSVIQAFLDALVTGDGHRYPNGKINLTTVSSSLAYGVAWLVLKMGYLPSLYKSFVGEEKLIQGRQVNQSPYQYSVVWYEEIQPERKMIETEKFFLIPIREISSVPFEGDVYNMEVEEEHNYLADFLLVSNCQNWITSQVGRDESSEMSIDYVRKASPEQLVDLARRAGASVVASSYNEPLITSEWSVGIFKLAQAAGMKCVYVSNGNATPEALKYLRPYLVGYKIDLKTMQDKHYRQLGGVLEHVLASIKMAYELGLWVEVVTLVVPGFNDSTDELMDAARYISSVSPDIPWHVTAFHPDYRMTDPSSTSAATILRAAEIGQEAGLNFVYAGNLTGRVSEYENTYCPHCRELLIKRHGYTLYEYRIPAEGACPKCHSKVPGIWTSTPGEVRLGGPGMPRLVMR